MTLPTWGDLEDYHCAEKLIRHGSAVAPNPYYEDCARRRYNYATSPDVDTFRLVFLQGVLENPDYRTLRRGGRFIWCRNLQYEGRLGTPWRHVSFTVDQGQKRFCVAENQMLCIPSKCFIDNNRYLRSKKTLFRSFSSVFDYDNSLSALARTAGLTRDQLTHILEQDNPLKAGTLVAPRLGYFYPKPAETVTPQRTAAHPCGLVVGHALTQSEYFERAFYRVRFGGTTYERIHPVELEIINEV